MKRSLIFLAGSVLLGCTSVRCSQCLADCSDRYSVVFSDDSRWGEGVHTVNVTFRLTPRGATNETWTCLVYPYFSGINSSCQSSGSSLEPHVGGGGISFRLVEYVLLEIRDEAGWEQVIEIKDPKYETEVVCGKECQVGTKTVTLTGPGGPAAATHPPFEQVPYMPNMSDAWGGAGGEDGVETTYGSGHLGARCYGDGGCVSPYYCRNEFLGWQGICTLRCNTSADCPAETVCAHGILDPNLAPIDGYCLRPCDEALDCSVHGSQCNVQPVGTYCF